MDVDVGGGVGMDIDDIGDGVGMDIDAVIGVGDGVDIDIDDVFGIGVGVEVGVGVCGGVGVVLVLGACGGDSVVLASVLVYILEFVCRCECFVDVDVGGGDVGGVGHWYQQRHR